VVRYYAPRRACPGTRLLLKIVIPRRRWYTEALALGDLPMARRQLLNLKAHAEGRG
jgi:hypothetical protein